jgi:hypothetical protein
VKGGIVVFLTLIAAKWLTAEARKAKSRQVGQDEFFPPLRATELICSIAFAMGTAFIYFGARGPQPDRAEVVLIGLFFVIFSSVVWPKGIWFSELAVRQRAWYGGWKIIPWVDVLEVKERNDGSVIIRGAYVKIGLTKFHGGRDLFLQEVRRHCPRITAHLMNVRLS